MDRQTTHRRGFFGRLAAVLGGMATLSVLARPARADSHRRFVYGYGGGGFGGGSNRRFIYGGSRGRFVNPGGGFGGAPGGFNIYMPRNDPVRPWAIDALSLLEA